MALAEKTASAAPPGAGWLWFPAPGKLNLMLRVLRRREDGYHELQTVFRLVDRADLVGVRVRGDGRVSRVGEVTGVPEADDLALAAARLLQSEAKVRLGADLTLDKRLPVGGGMGGGSSDAATVLLVLNRLWGAALDRPALAALARRLGADVPFFVFGRNAWGEGIGERLTPIEVEPAWYAVLVPPVAVSTARIYADPALTRQREPLTIPRFFRGPGANDLEPVATRRHPEIAVHLAWLRARAPQAHMTGSGACVYAEFATESEARAVLAQLPDTMRGFVTRGLDRHPLGDWAA